MADRDDPPPSYDPRSWAAGGDRRPEQQPEASFDPRTWAGTSPPETVARPVTSARPGRTGSAILAGAIALILFSLGGAAAYLARQEHGTEVRTPAPEPEVVVEQQ